MNGYNKGFIHYNINDLLGALEYTGISSLEADYIYTAYVGGFMISDGLMIRRWIGSNIW